MAGTQNWVTPQGTDPHGLAFLTYMLDRTDALRANFSGSTEPASKAAYMLWADTASGMLKIRNAANTAWIALLPLAKPLKSVMVLQGGGALAAKELQIAVPMDATIERVVLVPDTATASSVASTTEWTWALRNVTQAVELFSATPSTATVVGGVGGDELAADTAYSLAPDQNQGVDQLDVLRFTIGVNGSPTAVPDVSIAVVYTGRGA